MKQRKKSVGMSGKVQGEAVAKPRLEGCGGGGKADRTVSLGITS
jgi:hypothetical protein